VEAEEEELVDDVPIWFADASTIASRRSRAENSTP
jgi:hypothetical protein